MIKYNGKRIIGAEYANHPAQRMLFNGIEVWRRGTTDIFLDVQPETIWLTQEDNSTAEFNVYSNTTWKIE
jgi:hypothetical protein